MKAVILAAGRGTRMGSLTESIPKTLLRIGEKNLLEYKLELLHSMIEEVIIVIGQRGKMIEKYFGNNYKGLPLRYVSQVVLDGTAGALWRIKDLLVDDFIVMAGDDLYGEKTLLKTIETPWSMTISVCREMNKSFNNVLITKKGFLEKIDFEATTNLSDGRIDTCLYHLGPDIFAYQPIKIFGTEEYGLPHTINIINHDIPIKVLEANFWVQINTPQDLAEAEKIII